MAKKRASMRQRPACSEVTSVWLTNSSMALHDRCKLVRPWGRTFLHTGCHLVAALPQLLHEVVKACSACWTILHA